MSAEGPTFPKEVDGLYLTSKLSQQSCSELASLASQRGYKVFNSDGPSTRRRGAINVAIVPIGELLFDGSGCLHPPPKRSPFANSMWTKTKWLMSDQAALSFLKNGTNLPGRGNAVASAILEDVHLTVSGLPTSEKTKAHALAALMGATVYGDMVVDSVTHVISRTVSSEKCRFALNAGTPIICPEWLESCAVRQEKVECLPFFVKDSFLQGVTVVCTGLEQIERDDVERKVISGGGVYSGALILENAKNIVLIAEEPSGRKFEAAVSSRIPIVRKAWIDACMNATEFVSVKKFEIPHGLHVKEATVDTPPDHVSDNLNNGDGEWRELITAKSGRPRSLAKLNVFFPDAKTPMEAIRAVRQGGGGSFLKPVPNITHICVPDCSDSNKLSLLSQCQLPGLRPEELYVCTPRWLAQKLTCLSAAASDDLPTLAQAIERLNDEVHGFSRGTHAIRTNGQVAVPEVAANNRTSSATSHSVPAAVASGLPEQSVISTQKAKKNLDGEVFTVDVDADYHDKICKVIIGHGAQICRSKDSTLVRPMGRLSVLQVQEALSSHRAVVSTARVLYQAATNFKPHNPDFLVFNPSFKPATFAKALQNIRVSCTNMKGPGKLLVELLCNFCGCTFSESLRKTTTHFIVPNEQVCKAKLTDKMKLARNAAGANVLKLDWLICCVVQGCLEDIRGWDVCDPYPPHINSSARAAYLSSCVGGSGPHSRSPGIEDDEDQHAVGEPKSNDSAEGKDCTQSEDYGQTKSKSISALQSSMKIDPVLVRATQSSAMQGSTRAKQNSFRQSQVSARDSSSLRKKGVKLKDMRSAAPHESAQGSPSGVIPLFARKKEAQLLAPESTLGVSHNTNTASPSVLVDVPNLPDMSSHVDAEIGQIYTISDASTLQGQRSGRRSDQSSQLSSALKRAAQSVETQVPPNAEDRHSTAQTKGSSMGVDTNDQLKQLRDMLTSTSKKATKRPSSVLTDGDVSRPGSRARISSPAIFGSGTAVPPLGGAGGAVPMHAGQSGGPRFQDGHSGSAEAAANAYQENKSAFSLRDVLRQAAHTDLNSLEDDDDVQVSSLGASQPNKFSQNVDRDLSVISCMGAATATFTQHSSQTKAATVIDGTNTRVTPEQVPSNSLLLQRSRSGNGRNGSKAQVQNSREKRSTTNKGSQGIGQSHVLNARSELNARSSRRVAVSATDALGSDAGGMVSGTAGISFTGLGSEHMPTEIDDGSNIDNAVFQLSNVSSTEKKRCIKLLKNLGVQASHIIDSTHHDPRCTHMILGTVALREKVLCSLLSGCWILHVAYVESSSAENKLLPCRGFEWGEYRKPGVVPKGDAQTVLEAIRRRRAKQPVPRPYLVFDGLRVVVSLMPAVKAEGMEYVLKAGGALIIGKVPSNPREWHGVDALIVEEGTAEYKQGSALLRSAQTYSKVLSVDFVTQSTIRLERQSLESYFLS